MTLPAGCGETVVSRPEEWWTAYDAELMAESTGSPLTSSCADGARPDATFTLFAGAALHIPKGMWHQISSTAGTLAFSVRVADATAFAACK